VTKVAIIGCGPSGLLAAHACAQFGIDAKIYTLWKKPSVMTGAMYLHTEIPKLTNKKPDAKIQIKKFGTKEGYARKVYGNEEHPVSWDHFEEGLFPMWSLRSAYKQAWMMYGKQITTRKIDRIQLEWVMARHDLTIVTAPKLNYCMQPVHHHFDRQPIWVRMFDPGDYLAVASMTYSGSPEHPWYRRSQIDQFISYEYATEPPFNGLATGYKPTGNNCDCWPLVLWAGRFGAWQKGVLTHHVYEETRNALLQML
jgi:hypothetical protein